MSSTVEQIKSKLSIVDVVGSYMKLDKAGANFKGKCPFHNERTPSFFVSPDRGSFYCFGCGAKGDIFSFVEQFEGVDFKGALTLLADRAGVKIVAEAPGKRSEKEVLLDIMEKAALFYQANLEKAGTADGSPKEYLLKRGLSLRTMDEWRVGYASLDWQLLKNHLESKGIKAVDIERAGLIKRSEKNRNEFYDRFRGRIMFPIFDTLGRVVGFSGRILVDDGKSAKYINSPETPLFDKSRILYGFHAAKGSIRKLDYALLVEGQMDLLMAHQGGFTNTVATSGTALTASQLELLKRLSSRLMIAYDADSAGVNAAERGFREALSLGVDVKIAALPAGKDPAELIKEDIEAFRKALRGATHIIEFQLKHLLGQNLDRRMLGKKVEEKVVPYIASLESAIEKSHFISKVSTDTGISEDALRKEVERRSQGAVGEVKENAFGGVVKATGAVTPHRRAALERKIISLLFWLEGSDEPAYSPEDLIQKITATITAEKLEELRKKHEGAKEELLFEAEASYEGQHFEKNLHELLANLREDTLKDQFMSAMKELQAAEKAQNTEMVILLLKKCQQLSEELQKLPRPS